MAQGKLLPNGRETFAGRPGAEMEPIDFEAVRRELEEKHGEKMRDVEVISRYVASAGSQRERERFQRVALTMNDSVRDYAA